MYILYLYTILLMILPHTGFGQINDFTDEEKSTKDTLADGKQAVADLKEGALIVRLKSKSKKIDALEKLFQDGAISKASYEAGVQRVIKERTRENKKIAEAFLNYYDFSAVYIIYDSSSTLVAKGTTKDIFLNENLELDPTIQLKETPVVFTRIGRTDLSDTSGMIGMIFQNQQFEDLTRPFPYFLRLYPLGNTILGALENDTSVSAKRMKKLVAKWNEKLKKIYLDISADLPDRP